MDARAHSQVAELLSAYIDGQVSAADCTLVERHLATCPTCARNVATLRQTVSLLKKLPAMPAPRAFTLSESQVRPPRPVVWRWFFGVPALAGGLATLACVVVIGGVVLLGRLMPGRAEMPVAMAPAPALTVGTPAETVKSVADDEAELTEPSPPAEVKPFIEVAAPTPTLTQTPGDDASAPTDAFIAAGNEPMADAVPADEGTPPQPPVDLTAVPATLVPLATPTPVPQIARQPDATAPLESAGAPDAPPAPGSAEAGVTASEDEPTPIVIPAQAGTTTVAVLPSAVETVEPEQTSSTPADEPQEKAARAAQVTPTSPDEITTAAPDEAVAIATDTVEPVPTDTPQPVAAEVLEPTATTADEISPTEEREEPAATDTLEPAGAPTVEPTEEAALDTSTVVSPEAPAAAPEAAEEIPAAVTEGSAGPVAGEQGLALEAAPEAVGTPTPTPVPMAIEELQLSIQPGIIRIGGRLPLPEGQIIEASLWREDEPLEWAIPDSRRAAVQAEGRFELELLAHPDGSDFDLFATAPAKYEVRIIPLEPPAALEARIAFDTVPPPTPEP